MADHQLLTVAQMARELRVYTQTLRRLAKQGIVPHFDLGLTMRFDRNAVMEALQRGADIAKMQAERDDLREKLATLASLLHEGVGYIEEAESPGEAWDGLTAAWRAEVDGALHAAKEGA